MRPIVKTVGSSAAATASLAALQTTAGAGYLTLAATSFTGGYAQQASLTSTGALNGINFTFVGTDADGHPTTETIAGPNNNTVTTTNFWLTITSIYASAAVGTNVSAGNTALSISSTFVLDYINAAQNWGFQFVVPSGTLTYKLQWTYDDVFDTTAVKNWIDDTTITGKTAGSNLNGTGNYRGARIALTAYTSGTVVGTLVQGLQA